MHKQWTISASAGAALFMLSATTWSAEPRTTSFERTDASGDGVISREEYRDRMVEVFYSADHDRNGYLDIDELGDPDPDLLNETDRDRDGRVRLREFLNRRARDFVEADRDGDGTLSEEEEKEF